MSVEATLASLGLELPSREDPYRTRCRSSVASRQHERHPGAGGHLP
jgi:hypothetical protein